jgi:hypothetical protein
MRHLPRRTFLKGLGVTLGLPFLESMIPSLAAAESLAAGGPTRMAFMFFPNGAIMRDWRPQTVGCEFELPKTLAALTSHRSDLLVFTGLDHDNGDAKGDGPGDHARSCSVFLTGAHPRKTPGADIEVGTSIDQMTAAKIGHLTRLPSLELGIESGRQAGSCDSGYSCAYSSNIAWKSPTQPVTKEVSPRLAFERLFGDSSDKRAQAERDFYRKSILDFVAGDASRIQSKLGQTDRRKLDEYFTSVREVELRIARANDDSQKAAPEFKAPEGIPGDLTEHVRLMYDLMVLAFQTDSTRIATFMLASEGSNRTYREVEVKEGHHELSHHRNDEEKLVQLQKIDQYLMEQFSYFLDRMKSVEENGATLLDRSMLLYGCAIADGNRHEHHNLPVLMAGRGNGTIVPGRHMKIDKGQPMSNLFLSMMDRMGVHEERIGDSTGRLEGLDSALA